MGGWFRPAARRKFAFCRVLEHILEALCTAVSHQRVPDLCRKHLLIWCPWPQIAFFGVGAITPMGLSTVTRNGVIGRKNTQRFVSPKILLQTWYATKTGATVAVCDSKWCHNVFTTLSRNVCDTKRCHKSVDVTTKCVTNGYSD